VTWVAIGIAAVGTVTTLYGQQQAKKAGKADANFLAGQQLEAAARSRAVGQRQALDERRQTAILESALQARAGGGGMDPTVVKLSTDIAGEGEYRALSALYEGESGALGLESQAHAGLRSADARGRAMDLQSAGTLISSGSTFYSKYSGAAGPSSGIGERDKYGYH
jgi:hypothetical protein